MTDTSETWPSPEYENDKVNAISGVTEFTNDVYVYGKLYADVFGSTTGDANLDLSGSDLSINNLLVSGVSTFYGPVDMDYLTVYQRFNVGASGTVFTAISTSTEYTTGNRVGIGTTQPVTFFQVGVADTSFIVTKDGLVGIGTTQPDGKFQVGDNYFTITDKGGIGIGTTQPDGKFQIGDECLTVRIDPCRVGIGTTLPDAKFQVGYREKSIAFASDPITGVTSVGIGTTQPYQRLQVGERDDSFVVTETGIVGIGSTDPGNIPGYSSSEGELRLNVEGTVKIDRNIIDSADSIGANGYYLNRDGRGIRWVQASPISLDGMYVQDEGVDLPTGGTAQLFQWLNFTQINSQGTGIDNLIPIPDPANPTAIAKIQTQDFWGYTGSDIYRMTKVGIKNSSPSYDLDITGTLHATQDVQFDAQLTVDGNTLLKGTLTVNQATDLDSTLNVDGATTLNSTLDVDGGTTLNSTLDVDGATTLNNTLDVDGQATFNDGTDSSSPTTGSVQIDGGLGIVKKLYVGNDATIQGTTESTTKDTGALIVEGGVGIEKKLNVGDDAKIWGNTESDDKDTGALVVDGGVGIEKKLNVGDDAKIWGNTQSDDKDTGALVVEGGVGIERNLNVGENTKLIGTLELENHIIDYFNNNGVGICKTDYRLSSFNVGGVGAGVSWRPSGVQTKRTIWVTKNGCDTNSGLLEGDAKHTIGAAAEIAQEGDTIKVRSGIYVEDNPIGLRNDVAVSGEDLRLVTLIPKNTNKDFFHVRRGCLVENLSFSGETLATTHVGCGAVAFPPTQASINAGTDFQAVNGYTSVGPANEGASGRWKSPYVRNCTNFMTASVGMKINGDHANANFSGTNNLGQDIKSMVCDSFTQYNESGIGVSLTNNAYAQLVSIFTIGCDKGIYCDTGGQCDLTNSNSSFGNFGLFSNGYGSVEFDGVMQTTSIAESDVFEVTNVRDFNSPRQFRTPFDGQGVYFHLDMNDFEDTPATATITQPLQLVRSLKITNGGNTGEYSASAPPIITVDQGPLGPEGILPEFSPNVSAAGTITSIDVINSGRNYLPTQNITITIPGSATADVDTDPILYTVSEATGHDNVGFTAITMNEFIPYEVKAGTKVELVRLSRIITSSHSFEYIGAGVDLNTANPFQGGKPIPENEVVAINGGQCPFTSTDQKGNFRIGDGLTIDQTTSTIRGRDFNRAIQAQLTPLILALR